MKAEIKDGNLILTIPHVPNLKDRPETKSRLSATLATSNGIAHSIPVTVNGKQEFVEINLNAYVPIPGRRKLKDGSTVDSKGTVLVDVDGNWV